MMVLKFMFWVLSITGMTEFSMSQPNTNSTAKVSRESNEPGLSRIEHKILRQSREKLNKITSVKDLQKYLNITDRDFSYTGPRDITAPDLCSPRLTTIEIPQPQEYNKYYWPKCTRVKRCGGCTEHESLECVPTDRGKVSDSVQVVRLKYDNFGPSGLTLDRVVYIDLETHTECRQVCRVREEDCDDKIHNYSPDDCSCHCKPYLNTRCTHPTTWDKKSCRCTCPKLKKCGHGLYFNEILCTCQHYRGHGGSKFASANTTFEIENGKSGSNQVDSNRINRNAEPKTESNDLETAAKDLKKESSKKSTLIRMLSTKLPTTTTTTTVAATTTTTRAPTTATTTRIPQTRAPSTTVTETTPRTSQSPTIFGQNEKPVNPCASLMCPFTWKPVLQRNGLCGCIPNLG